MRIYLKLTKNNVPVPFDHYSVLAGKFHNWIKDTNIHDSVSLYSFSWLRGGITKNGYLNFQNGGEWFISVLDDELLLGLITEIKNNPKIAFGMSVNEIILRENPVFSDNHKFLISNPILIKRTIDNSIKYFTYSDVNSNMLLADTLKTKLSKVGLNDDNLKVEFDNAYDKRKTKLITYKGIKNKVSWCPVIITGKPETFAFAWNVGIGNSTGIGFGALL